MLCKTFSLQFNFILLKDLSSARYSDHSWSKKYPWGCGTWHLPLVLYSCCVVAVLRTLAVKARSSQTLWAGFEMTARSVSAVKVKENHEVQLTKESRLTIV